MLTANAKARIRPLMSLKTTPTQGLLDQLVKESIRPSYAPAQAAAVPVSPIHAASSSPPAVPTTPYVPVPFVHATFPSPPVVPATPSVPVLQVHAASPSPPARLATPEVPVPPVCAVSSSPTAWPHPATPTTQDPPVHADTSPAPSSPTFPATAGQFPSPAPPPFTAPSQPPGVPSSLPVPVFWLHVPMHDPAFKQNLDFMNTGFNSHKRSHVNFSFSFLFVFVLGM